MEENNMAEQNISLNWKMIAEYFDKRGRIGLYKRMSGDKDIFINIVEKDLEFLKKIKSFLGYGEITQRKDLKNTFIFNIYNKKHVYAFLKEIYPYILLRKEVVKFILKNYHFFKMKNSNEEFDDKEFEVLNCFWKSEIKKLKKQSEELEGGEE